MDPANASLLNPAGASRPYVAAPSSSSSPSSLPPANFPHDSHPRLSLVSPTRITAGSVVSALIGFSLGATQGATPHSCDFAPNMLTKCPTPPPGGISTIKPRTITRCKGDSRRFQDGSPDWFLELHGTVVGEHG
uniref:Uncharacterized protein n=1 Tax=Bionectria ochroleuca TaxID=29856 RepID=A0A8H7KD50_BIOOC